MSKSTHLQVHTSDGKNIGHFDGEFFYTTPAVNLRVDGDEVYTLDMPCKYVGTFEENAIKLLDGSIPYYFTE